MDFTDRVRRKTKQSDFVNTTGDSAISAIGTIGGAVAGGLIAKADAQSQRDTEERMNKDMLALNKELGLKTLETQATIENNKLIAQVLLAQQAGKTAPVQAAPTNSKVLIIAGIGLGITAIIVTVILIRRNK